MFLISDKIDKERETYEAVTEEANAMEHDVPDIRTRSGGNKDKIFSRCDNKHVSLFVLLGILSFVGLWIGIQLLMSHGTLTCSDSTGTSPYLLATRMINEARETIEAVRRNNALMSTENRQNATEYMDNIQTELRKRVEKRVKTISQLVQEKVQDMENQLAVFERVISTAVDGNLEYTKNFIEKTKSKLDATSGNNDPSMLNDAIEEAEKHMANFTNDLEKMYSFYGPYINTILHHKSENVTHRIRMILVADRKLFRNAAQSRISVCYNIARQNYDISNNLETIFEALNRLRSATETVNAISSMLTVGDTAVSEAQESLAAMLNESEQALYAMMNTDGNFLGTVLKELAFERHIEMKDFIILSYETAIRVLVPAVEKVSRNFQVVREAHWQRITNVFTPVLADVSNLIQTKTSLIPDEGVRKRVRNSAFVSLYTLVEDKFKNSLTTVNSQFETKQGQMFEGLTMALDFTIAEQLPVISTWSLQNYLPAETCPMSIDFQTYLKAIMDRYLSPSNHSEVVPAILENALNLDANFTPAEIASTADKGVQTDLD